MYTPIYVRNISFALHFYIPEHYRCSLMRTLRDIDLHRPATWRRRRVELPNPPNIRHNTEHNYMNLLCLKTRHTVNITRTTWPKAPPLPIPHTTYPQKKTIVSSQNPTLQTPSFPKAPRSRRGKRPPSSELARNYGWAYSQSPPSIVWRIRIWHTYRTSVDRSISFPVPRVTHCMCDV